MGALSTFTDFYIIAIPMMAISGLNMSFAKKLGVSALLETISLKIKDALKVPTGDHPGHGQCLSDPAGTSKDSKGQPQNIAILNPGLAERLAWRESAGRHHRDPSYRRRDGTLL
jgi:hypothetical protein